MSSSDKSDQYREGLVGRGKGEMHPHPPPHFPHPPQYGRLSYFSCLDLAP